MRCSNVLDVSAKQKPHDTDAGLSFRKEERRRGALQAITRGVIEDPRWWSGRAGELVKAVCHLLMPYRPASERRCGDPPPSWKPSYKCLLMDAQGLWRYLFLVLPVGTAGDISIFFFFNTFLS